MLLDREKQARLQAAGLRLEDAYLRLHDCVQDADAQHVETHHRLVTALTMERDELERLPTWPWRPETPRLLVTAVLLPTAVFVVQRLLELCLGL